MLACRLVPAKRPTACACPAGRLFGEPGGDSFTFDLFKLFQNLHVVGAPVGLKGDQPGAGKFGTLAAVDEALLPGALADFTFGAARVDV